MRSNLSDADLLQAVRSTRAESHASGSAGGLRRRGTSEADLRSERSGRRSVLRSVGSHCSSSPSRSSKSKAMTFSAMQEHVFNTAMDKYIKDLEAEAKVSNAANAQMKQKILDGLESEKNEKVKARELAQQNQLQVREQIEENKNRRAHTRKAYVEAASAHQFPLFTETFISQDEVDEYRKNVKKSFREELDRQRETQAVLRNMLVKKDREYAAEKLRSNTKTMTNDRAKERQRLKDQGDEMMRVWDRDIRLKNIKMAILSGKDVKEGDATVVQR